MKPRMLTHSSWCTETARAPRHRHNETPARRSIGPRSMQCRSRCRKRYRASLARPKRTAPAQTNANARDRRIGHGRDGAFLSAHHARHDHVQAQASADTMGKTRQDETRLARPQDNQHADQSHHGCKPAANPNPLTEKKDRQRVTNSGETNPVADASAMGRNRKPEMKKSEDANSATPRINCRPRRSDCKAYNGEPGSIAGTMITPKTRNRRSRQSRSTAMSRKIFRGGIRDPEKYG